MLLRKSLTGIRGELHMSVQRKNTETIRTRKKRKRRRRQLKLFLLLSGTASVLLLVCAWLINRTTPPELPRPLLPEQSEVMDRTDQYPPELLELLAQNEETADFVRDYPDKKDAAPAETISSLEEGEIPLLLQWDERWGYTLYGNSLLAISGCGPTTLSMVAAGLTGDNTITPHRVAAYAEENGYYVEGSGSSWSLMTEGCRNFGVAGQELPLSENKIFSELEAGHPIICSMRPGDFTTTGHFIVLTGVDGSQIQVHDPNSKSRSRKLWDYDTLEHQINNLWSFTLLPS